MTSAPLSLYPPRKNHSRLLRKRIMSAPYGVPTATDRNRAMTLLLTPGFYGSQAAADARRTIDCYNNGQPGGGPLPLSTDSRS